MFVAGLIGVLASVAVPQTMAAVHRARTAAAARYRAAQMALARSRAVARSASVALRFEAEGEDYTVAVFVDGDGNGVRAADILAGVDPPLEPPVRLSALFPGVSIALSDDEAGADPVHIGRTSLMSFTPAGTSTPGSIYVRGYDGTQLVVRVLGATGRARVLRQVPTTNRWIDLY